MGRKKLVRDEEDVPPPIIKHVGATKSKKKTVVIDDDEYAVGTEASLEDYSNQVNGVLQEVGPLNPEPKKQAKPVFREDISSVPVISGKKKSKVKKDGISSRSGFGMLEVDDDEEIVLNKIEHDDCVFEERELDGVVFTGKKKPSKSTKKPSSNNVLDAPSLDNGDTGFPLAGSDVNGVQTISFSGKKKPSKHKKEINITSMFSAFGELDAGEEKDDEKPEPKPETCYPEKKSGDFVQHVKDEDVAAVTFDGKKKPSKKKVVSVDVSHEPDNKPTVELEGQVNTGPPENVNNNNKKKKKKAGRTAEEEEDLDKILAELGGETIPKIEPAVVIVEETRPENGAEEAIESAAAKKRKKKKEKEKERKAAAAAVPKENEKKTEGKTIPKHVREMQEALARRKEAEERQKKEEEEKERREKEEMRKQEELARLTEEAKRRKKEKEKEKIQKKKQEGKFLTGKQKEEARRLEAVRNQILANSGGLPLSSGDGVAGPVTKRPVYISKRSRVPSSQPMEVVEVPETIPEAEAETAEEKSGVLDVEKTEAVAEHKSEAVAEEEEEEEDDDWDAKSWDDTVVVLPEKNAFADEEAESEPELEIAPVVKKEMKGGKPAEPIKPGWNKGGIEEEKVEAEKTEEELRSPICCIMGHVDTGKTKLLDCIRGTNVQEGEAGGITQQIGATYFPAENIRERTKELKADAKLKVPGLLVIDTPGHESFTNLRSRGSGLCDIAVLVVDVMHGLEPQTVESINLLKMKGTEFIVALNKVDRLYGWKVCRNSPIVKAMKQQTKDVQNEFNMRLVQIITQFKEQGLNTELYYKNREMKETFSIVPTSAITGEGIPDLLLLLVQWTQKTMVEKLTFSNEIQCTVLEVKVVEGHGTTIDVVLVNGVLHEGDQIVVCGMQGPIVTTIRALLTPHPMKELRIKGTYLHHKQIKAAQGIKITAQGLEHAVAGTGLHVVGAGEEVEEVKERAMEDMKSVMSKIDKSGEGVYVQASTLGSLEALLEFLKSPAVMIPVSGIGIGPVHKKDVMKASVMLEKKKKEFGTILAFDVKITQEARELSEELGVKIFIADIIYHLFDQFKAYLDTLKEERKKDAADDVVFPCLLKIIPNCIFNKKDPIVLGVDVLEGILKIGTQICVPEKEFVDIGRVASIEFNHKPVDVAKKGQKVAIKIVGTNVEEQQKMYGRHFEMEDTLVSHITRRSIDILKTSYRDELSIEEWKLLVKLKNLFKIP